MRNLTLLIRKDIHTAFLNGAYILLLLCIWILVVAVNPAMMPLMYVMVFYVSVISLFSTEENDLVCNVAGILPVRKSRLVVARYLYTYLVLAFQALLTLLFCPCAEFVLKKQTDWAVMMGLSLTVCLLMMSVVLPLIYWFGILRMRIVTIVLYLMMVVVASTFGPIARYALPGASLGGGTAVGVGVALALSLLSLAISLRIKR